MNFGSQKLFFSICIPNFHFKLGLNVAPFWRGNDKKWKNIYIFLFLKYFYGIYLPKSKRVCHWLGWFGFYSSFKILGLTRQKWLQKITPFLKNGSKSSKVDYFVRLTYIIDKNDTQNITNYDKSMKKWN